MLSVLFNSNNIVQISQISSIVCVYLRMALNLDSVFYFIGRLLILVSCKVSVMTGNMWNKG